MTDTPRTSDQAVRYYDDATGIRIEYVPSRFARQLEREINQLRRWTSTNGVRELEKERDQLRTLVVEMREALEANRVFHTPLELRKHGGDWNEFQLDAIHRTRDALRMDQADD